MAKPRGKMRKVILLVGEIQGNVGYARELHFNDVSQTSFEQAQDLLKEAFDLCIEITAMYDPVESKGK